MLPARWKYNPKTKKVITVTKTTRKPLKKRSSYVTLNRNILKAPRTKIKMKWCKNFHLVQSTIDLPTHQIMRYTSLFDPDFTSVSIADHQPWSYDTYSTLYKHYMVTGCSAKVSACQYGPNDGLTSIFLTNSAVSAPANLSSYTELMENPASHGGIINSTKPRTFKKRYNKNRVYGITQNANLTGLMGGLGVGSNPDEEYYLLISIINANPDAEAPSCIITLELTYDVELTENKTLAQS